MGIEKLLVGVPVLLGGHAAYTFYTGVQQLQDGLQTADIMPFVVGGLEVVAAGVTTIYALHKINRQKTLDRLDDTSATGKQYKSDDTLKRFLDSNEYQ